MKNFKFSVNRVTFDINHILADKSSFTVQQKSPADNRRKDETDGSNPTPTLFFILTHFLSESLFLENYTIQMLFLKKFKEI